MNITHLVLFICWLGYQVSFSTDSRLKMEIIFNATLGTFSVQRLLNIHFQL